MFTITKQSRRYSVCYRGYDNKGRQAYWIIKKALVQTEEKDKRRKENSIKEENGKEVTDNVVTTVNGLIY